MFVAVNGVLFAVGMLLLSKKRPALLENLCPELCAAAWNALVLGIFMGGEASYTTDLGGAGADGDFRLPGLSGGLLPAHTGGASV